MNSIGKLLILIMVFLLCACTSGVMGKYGYWINEKPYSGTTDRQKFYKKPYWQCVNIFPPNQNKEC